MRTNVAKKVTSLILLFALLTVASISFARWSCIYECENSLLDASTWLSKKLDFYADMTTYEDYYCGLEAQLQKLGDDGETWNNVNDKYYEVFAEEDFCKIEETVRVSAGTYRFEIVNNAYATNGALLESAFTYTKTVTVY